MRARTLTAVLVMVLVATPLAVLGCRKVVFDIVTTERTVRTPQSGKEEFVLDTRIELPTTLGVDKTVDSATLDLSATNFNLDNPVTVDLTIADNEAPGFFRPIILFELQPGETRQFHIVQTAPDDGLVRASQTKSLTLRFDSVSPQPGIGELEFTFSVRILAHKETPGTGAGTLLFY